LRWRGLDEQLRYSTSQHSASARTPNNLDSGDRDDPDHALIGVIGAASLATGPPDLQPISIGPAAKSVTQRRRAFASPDSRRLRK